MRIYFAGILGVFFCFSAFSQQEAQFSQYMFNNMAINPGFAGSTGSICATSLVRQQWVGFKDDDNYKVNPQTLLISADGYVKKLKGGLGMTITQDKLGFEKNISLKAGYAYRTSVWKGKLGIGAQIGFLNKVIDYSKFKPVDEGDPALTGGSKEESGMLMDFSFGAFYRVGNQWHVGLSSVQLSEAKKNVGPASYKLRRHYFATGGYNYVLPSSPSFELQPGLLFKTDGTSKQLDVSTLLKYNNQVWGGVSYRVNDAYIIILGGAYKDIKIGYSYDFTASKLGYKGRSGGSHEIMVNYCFKIEKEKPIESYRNVRFL